MLTYRYKIGQGYEVRNLYRAISEGFKKYIAFHNSINPVEWLKNRGKGVDMIFQIGKWTVNVELSFCGKKYTYRTAWFIKQKFSRFKDVKDGKYVINLVVTNRPENFNVVKDLAKFLGIKIYHHSQLIMLIRKLIRIEENPLNKEEIKHISKEEKSMLYRMLFDSKYNVYSNFLKYLIKCVNSAFNIEIWMEVRDG